MPAGSRFRRRPVPDRRRGPPERALPRLNEQALLAFNLGEIRAAYIFTKNALPSDPFLLPAHILLGKIYLQLGRGERAERELPVADGLGAHSSLILIPLGRAFLLQDKATQLIAELFPLGTIAEEDAAVLALRGEAHPQLGELYDARRLLSLTLIRVSPPAMGNTLPPVEEWWG